jgi:hypothetical protein
MKQIDMIILGSILGICLLGAAGGSYAFYNSNLKNYNIHTPGSRSTYICQKRNGKFYLFESFEFEEGVEKGTITDYYDKNDNSNTVYTIKEGDEVQLLDDKGDEFRINEFYIVIDEGDVYLCKPNEDYQDSNLMTQHYRREGNVLIHVKGQMKIQGTTVLHYGKFDYLDRHDGGRKRKTRHTRHRRPRNL